MGKTRSGLAPDSGKAPTVLPGKRMGYGTGRILGRFPAGIKFVGLIKSCHGASKKWEISLVAV